MASEIPRLAQILAVHIIVAFSIELQRERNIPDEYHSPAANNTNQQQAGHLLYHIGQSECC